MVEMFSGAANSLTVAGSLTVAESITVGADDAAATESFIGDAGETFAGEPGALLMLLSALSCCSGLH